MQISRKTILLVVLIILFFLTQNSIIEIYNRNIVDNFFKHIEGNVQSLIWIIILIICTLIYFYYLFKEKKKIPVEIAFIAGFLLLIYIGYRFNSDYFQFHRSSLLPTFVFADYFIFLFGGIVILKLIELSWEKENAEYLDDPFLWDVPIENASDDKFHRKEIAERLANKIQSKLTNDTGKGSLAISINGEWGSGKTSFANMIKEKIDNKGRIIISFNPWRSASSSRIIEDFFELLIAELANFDSELSKNVASYANTLTTIDENSITKGIKTVSDFFFDEDNSSEYYDRVNRSIQKVGKQIIIFIDDLDRLDKKEIIEVLRIIRNTANFNNIVYVVCYDKSYVLEAVKDFNIHNYNNFLDKIFQFEFSLPYFDTAIIRNILKESLKSKLPQLSLFIDTSVDYTTNSGRVLTSQTIRSIRDVVRFSNTLLFELKPIQYDVNFIDFYLLQLIKLKYPFVYTLLSSFAEVVFIKEDSKIRLRKESERNESDVWSGIAQLVGINNTKQDKENDEDILLSIIDGAIDYSDFDRTYIYDLLSELLKEKVYRIGLEGIDYKSFMFYENYQKYFRLNLLESDFPSQDFEEIRLGDYQKYKEWVFEKIEEGRITDLLNRLVKIVDFTSFQEWQNHYKILIEIGKYQAKDTGMFGINVNSIIDALEYPNKNQGHKFFESVEQYKNYISRLFKDAPEPYVFESFTLNVALSQNKDLTIEKNEIEEILFNYLKIYTENHSELTVDLSLLRKYVVNVPEYATTDLIVQTRADELYKRHLQKYLKDCELAGFIKHTNPGEEYFQIAESWVIENFGNLESFDTYLKAATNLNKNSDCYQEFMKFYEQYNAVKHRAVIFEFKHLKPSRWR